MEPPSDLHLLPRVRDSWSFLYLERCTIDQDGHAIAVRSETGVTVVPCTMLTTLLLGPGTSITHAAVRTLTAAGCAIVWGGEAGVRCYATGQGETRSARHLLHQARMWADPVSHLTVVRRMYGMRFPEPLGAQLSIQQIRGMEGVRVRDAYATMSRETGVPWRGRTVPRPGQPPADAINRALSASHSCMYGICHAAIISAGYSTGLGFVHTGKMLAFVYDIADLYKVEIAVPAAFQAVARHGESGIEGHVRRACRDLFHERRLLDRIIPDIDRVLAVRRDAHDMDMMDGEFAALPGGLWDPDAGVVEGGRNWADGGPKPPPGDASETRP